MLKGSKVGLRARHEDDIPVLRAELYDDVVNGSRAESRPWRPITPGSKDSRLVVDDKEQGLVPFSVVELDGGTLVGTATLWVSVRRPAIPDRRAARTEFLRAATAVLAALAVSGLFSSLVPSFLREQLHVHNVAAVGAEVGLPRPATG
ncbi:hypothetical protein [Streptomyces olivochromogenes]|uniref:Uncharacterized protein n=1 Tax=Streptomyces olivochromogenes TaxID=1963 RepID=A0A286PG71_STROL|nr:hypothetical protein [Streptomyces olivochromogenes]GAX58550.1 hypothetical protein SO3561_10123 [Streptomyces olivochromogenes]